MKKILQSYYELNKDKFIKNRRERTWMLRDYLFQLKEAGGCADCGIKDGRVLEFDHVRGEKLVSPTRMADKGWSKDHIDQELLKCDIRCANCHRIKTQQRGRHMSLRVFP